MSQATVRSPFARAGPGAHAEQGGGTPEAGCIDRVPPDQARRNSVLSVAGSIVWGLGVGVAPLFLMKDQPKVDIVGGPLQELETELWVLAHPDIRHLQRVKLLFDFLKEDVRL
jgi:DNA-binding transcriptional LysR family regulator